MLHGFPRFSHLAERLAVFASGMERLDPDVVRLQEVAWVPPVGGAARYLAERTGVHHTYLRTNGRRLAIIFEEGEAILSRYPLAELQPRGQSGSGRIAGDLHELPCP